MRKSRARYTTEGKLIRPEKPPHPAEGKPKKGDFYLPKDYAYGKKEAGTWVWRPEGWKPKVKPPPPVEVLMDGVAYKLGPKMRELPNDNWRRFVLALLDQDKPNYAAAYRKAGFGSTNSNAVSAGSVRLAHDPRIIEAVQEEALARVKVEHLTLATHAIKEIIADPKHKGRLTAALAVWDRSGLNAIAEQKITVDRQQPLGQDPQQVERIKLMLETLGIGLDGIQKLLGPRLSPPIIESVPTTDADFTEEAPP